MAGEPTSVVQLGPDALNAVLEQFVNSQDGFNARFTDGQLHLNVKGLALVIRQLSVDHDGITVRLSIDSQPAG